MPYELSFTKRLEIADREEYINDCCVGGDRFVDYLLPAVRERYSGIDTGQEDWGWYIWFRKGNVRLAVDVFTDDAEQGEFRVLLSSRLKRLIFSTETDTPELDELRTLVEQQLSTWADSPVRIEKSVARDDKAEKEAEPR